MKCLCSQKLVGETLKNAELETTECLKQQNLLYKMERKFQNKNFKFDEEFLSRRHKIAQLGVRKS